MTRVVRFQLCSAAATNHAVQIIAYDHDIGVGDHHTIALGNLQNQNHSNDCCTSLNYSFHKAPLSAKCPASNCKR